VTAPLLRLEGVVVQRGHRTILALDELALDEGETLAVLGETGAGKSTLLQVAAGLVLPQRGRLYFRGEAMRFPLPVAIRRRMAAAFQEPLLFRGTVFDNVAYGVRLRGVRGRPLEERVFEALRAFGIEALAQRAAHTLSGGEAHRTCLARAVVLRPDLLLLDEPLASLDPTTRLKVEKELLAAIRNLGLTCLYVTHDQDEARRVASKVAILDRGQLAQAGYLEDVFARPHTERVARFLGVRNILNGRLGTAPDGTVEVEIMGSSTSGQVHRLRLGPGTLQPDNASSHVLVCIRAEDVVLFPGNAPSIPSSPSLVPSAQTAGLTCMEGTVQSLVTTGATVEVSLDCGFPLIVASTATTLATLGVKEGCRVRACVPANRIHLIPQGLS